MTGLSLTPEQARQTLEKFQHPIRFAKDVLGVKFLTPDEERVLNAVNDNKRVAVTAGQAVGKTHCAAILVLWYLFTRHGAQIFTTASSAAQLKDALWRQIRELHENSRVPLGGRVLLESIEIDARIRWFAVGRSTDDSTNIQGIHGPYVMALLDEATGIRPQIWQAVETLVPGPNDKIVCLGNPTDSSSQFYQECQKPGKWEYLSLSCEDHPNFIENRIVIPGATTREEVERMEREWGRDHPVFEARVLGRWSTRLGKMFPDFDPVLGGRHVYDPNKVKLDRWLTEWVGGDWGFAHDSAFYWLRSDGKHLWATDELVIAEQTPEQLARLIARKTDGRKLERIVISHDAMNRTEGPKSRARLMAEVWKPLGMPFPTRANTDRVGGWNLLTQLFRSDRISISNRCVRLIDALRKATRDPDKLEDMLKFEGDDPLDGFRYAVKVWDSVMKIPLDEQLRVALEPAVKSGNPNQRYILHERFMERVRSAKRASHPVLPAWQRAQASIKKRKFGGLYA